jgi:hypothetical protein
MDSPAEPFIHYEGGLGRYPRRSIPGAYRSEGSIELAADVSTLWYFLWLALGSKAATDTSGVTPVTGESIGTTDGDGNLSGSLDETPDDFNTIIVYDSGAVPVAQDDGAGFFRALTAVVDEDLTTGVGETTKVEQLDNQRVTPGTWELDDGGLVAHDDGAGAIVEDGASGISGTIDYINGIVSLTGLAGSTSYDMDYSHMTVATKRGTINYLTGAFALTGLGATEAHTADYSYGEYVHVITATDDMEMSSATVRLGKDLYEHIFAGSALSQLTMTVERELATISLDMTGGADEKGTIEDEDDLFLPQEFPIPFHKVSFGWADYGSAAEAINCLVDSLTFTINNNADGEGGLGLNSRYPCKIYAGNLDIMVDLTLKFESTQAKEDFWGGATGPTDDPTRKAAQIILDAGDFGDIQIDIPRCLINSVVHAPSGRARMTQAISLKVQYDPVSESLVTVTASVLADHK